MKKTLLIPLSLVLVLSGCEFFRSINNEDIRNAVETAAIESIRILNEKGFDPVKLKPNEVELATSACRIIGSILVEGTIEDTEELVELLALKETVCRILEEALKDGTIGTESEVVNG